MRIDFAHRPFPWTSDAAVHVVAVGFSDGGARAPKLLYEGAPGARPRAVARISPYLAEGPDVVVRPRRAPLGTVPPGAIRLHAQRRRPPGAGRGGAGGDRRL